MNPPSRGSPWAVLRDKMTSAYGEDVLTKAWADLKNGVCGLYKNIGHAGYTRKICSLARPFTLNNNFGGAIVYTFIPQSPTHGILPVIQKVDSMNGRIDAFGTYETEFLSNGEAFLHYKYSGATYIPGEGAVPFSSHKDQVDIQRTDDPSCP